MYFYHLHTRYTYVHINVNIFEYLVQNTYIHWGTWYPEWPSIYSAVQKFATAVQVKFEQCFVLIWLTSIKNSLKDLLLILPDSYWYSTCEYVRTKKTQKNFSARKRQSLKQIEELVFYKNRSIGIKRLFASAFDNSFKFEFSSKVITLSR
jgi:hypothetical protein